MSGLLGALSVVGKLLVAAILGGVVGLERESLNRPAGFRTHILVCMGSALIMMVSIDLFKVYHGQTAVDPGRIAAQVVSGIGFLGAGTIMHEGATVRGLTTAASLWVIAGIGLAVGAGLFLPAAATAGLVLLTLVFLARLDAGLLGRHQFHTLQLTVADRPGQLGRLGVLLGDRGVNIKNISMRPSAQAGYLDMELSVRLPSTLDHNALVQELLAMDGVYGLSQEA